MGAFYILFLGIKNGMSRECLHSRWFEPSACKADALLLPYGLFFFVGLDVFGYKKMECLGSACTLGGSNL